MRSSMVRPGGSSNSTRGGERHRLRQGARHHGPAAALVAGQERVQPLQVPASATSSDLISRRRLV